MVDEQRRPNWIWRSQVGIKCGGVREPTALVLGDLVRRTKQMVGSIDAASEERHPKPRPLPGLAVLEPLRKHHRLVRIVRLELSADALKAVGID